MKERREECDAHTDAVDTSTSTGHYDCNIDDYCNQSSNYSIIYEGVVKYSEPRNFFEAPTRPLQK